MASITDITTYQFFKVMIDDFRKKLIIPEKFMMKLREILSDNIKLVGPSGHVWTVKLVETADDIFLWSGWEEFVLDHCLQLHDFLVFKYSGNSSFNVTIFDKSGCEREGSYFIKKHSSCSDERCALEDSTRKVPVEVIDVDSPQRSTTKEPFRKRREGCSTKSADNKLKRPMETHDRKSQNADLFDATEVLDSSEDFENSEESLLGEEDCLPKEKIKRKSTFDGGYQTGGTRCQTSRSSKKNAADSRKKVSSVKPRRPIRYSYIPKWN